MRRHSKAKLYLFQGFFVSGNNAWSDGRRRLVIAVRDRLESGKTLLNQVNKFCVIQVPRSGDDDVVRPEPLPIETEQVFLPERAYCLLGSQNGFAQWMIFPEVLGEDLVDEVVGIVFVHLDLFQDHALFAHDVFGIEYRIQDQVAQDIDGDRQMLIQDLNVEADGLLAGEGIHVSANRVHLARNRLRRTCSRALEHHVFGEVRDAVEFRGFIARSAFHPDADGDGANVRHLFAQDDQFVGQHETVNVARFVNFGGWRCHDPGSVFSFLWPRAWYLLLLTKS